MLCARCARPLIFNPGQGWLHLPSMSLYIMRCNDCGYVGGTPIKCPSCNSTNYLDDHCVLPQRSVPHRDTVTG